MRINISADLKACWAIFNLSARVKQYNAKQFFPRPFVISVPAQETHQLISNCTNKLKNFDILPELVAFLEVLEKVFV